MKPKGYFLATAAAVVATGGAQAADLPVKAPAYAPAAAAVSPSWTGWYVGVNLGADWQMNQANYGSAPGEVFAEVSGGAAPAGNSVGVIGGGQLGYNYQVAPNWVLGVEGTIQGLAGKKATALAVKNNNKGNGFESHIDWMATFRGRVGWLMDPDTMLYGTAGVAWAGIKASEAPNGFASTGVGNYYRSSTIKSASKTKTGWVAGGGIEHRLTRKWTLGVEVLYHDFGTTTGYNTVPNLYGAKNTDFKNQVVTSTLKLNYKF